MADVMIYGAGAVGSFVGYLLSQATTSNSQTENVALLGRRNHIQKIREEGLRIELLDGSKSVHFKHCFFSLEELAGADFVPEMVIVCVKTYSLPAVCEELKRSDMLDGKLENAEFILLMNGMGNRETFAGLHLPEQRVCEGITSLGVRFSEDGRIELKGKGLTVFEDGISAKARIFLRERFRELGYEIEFAPDFKRHQWNKLFVNAVINPITALTGGTNGIVLCKHLEGIVERIVEECAYVARAEGLEADNDSILKSVYSVAKKTSPNTSSMLQDVRKEKETEIDSINGHLIQLAKKHKIDVPLNEALYAMVKAIECR